MSNTRAQERVKEARKRVDNLITQARELGINNFENMTTRDLQRAVHQARNRPVPAPRPPPDQIIRTRSVPQRPISRPRRGRPRTAAQIFLYERNIPILRPTPPTKTGNVESMKQLAGRIVEPVKKPLAKFADWILSYVPEPVKRTVNERVEKLKTKVNEIFERMRSQKFKATEHEAILKGYMKTFKIDREKT